MKKTKTPMTTTCIRIRKKTLEKVENMAEREERSVSEVMRLIIENYFKNIEIM